MVEMIMKYENGRMTEEEVIDFFQQIIESGLVWELQGSYGRMAQMLIDEGLCSPQRQFDTWKSNHSR